MLGLSAQRIVVQRAKETSAVQSHTNALHCIALGLYYLQI